jgi:hypothetical protein
MRPATANSGKVRARPGLDEIAHGLRAVRGASSNTSRQGFPLAGELPFEACEHSRMEFCRRAQPVEAAICIPAAGRGLARMISSDPLIYGCAKFGYHS